MRITKKFKIISLILLLSLFIVTIPLTDIDAQINSIDISVQISPEIPGPYENVNLTLISYVVDVNKLQISWYLNDQKKSSGIGKKDFSFTAGGVGSTSTVRIEMFVAEGGLIKKTITIQPASVDLLWETVNSYVPPFYKGKALPSSESKIKVVAVPNLKTSAGAKLKENDFTYNWERNLKFSQNLSGYGKSTYTFQNNYLDQSEKIELIISSIKDNYTAKKIINIPMVSPEIVFYEKNPLRGINYEKALTSDFSMQGKESTIVAEPYFFSPANPISEELRYEWSLNNESILPPLIKNNLVVRVAEAGGQAKLSLSIESLPRLFQSADKSIFINF